jgi:hypothetical protein
MHPMMRTITLGLVAAAVACGGGGSGTTDARTDAAVSDAPFDAPVDAMIDAERPDAGPAPVTEAPDCGGDPLVAHQGDLSLVVSALALLPVGMAYDLDGDGDGDNKVAAIGSIAQDAIDTELAAGTMVLPVEIFDRDPDPDACVKLALYTGACVTPGCDLTDAIPDTVTIDPASLDAGGVPLSRLRSMSTTATGAVTALPGVIRLDIPINDTDRLPMPITVQFADGMFTGTGPAAQLTGLRFGGTMQASRLDSVDMPLIEELGVMPGDTMLDGIFANLLGPLLAMPQSPHQTGCRAADIDLDADGIESFCDSDPDDDIKRVDTCIDGDGSVVLDGDGGVARCTDALIGGVPRFPDGVSAAFALTASPAVISP